MGTLWFLNGQGLKGRLPSWEPRSSSSARRPPPSAGAQTGFPATPTARRQRMATARSRRPRARRRDRDRRQAARPRHRAGRRTGKERAGRRRSRRRYGKADGLQAVSPPSRRAVSRPASGSPSSTTASTRSASGGTRSAGSAALRTASRSSSRRYGPDLTPSSITEDTARSTCRRSRSRSSSLRDRGSLRFPPVMITLSAFLIFSTTCYRSTGGTSRSWLSGPPPPARHDRRRRRSDDVDSYLPILAMLILGGRVRGLSFDRVRAPLDPPAHRGEGGALRVRHRAVQGAGRAVPRPLLPRGDDLHHLRHRDRVPLSVGRDLRPARASSASSRWSCSPSPSSSRSPTCSPTARSTGARPRRHAAGRSRSRRRPSARAARPSSGSRRQAA